MGVIFEQEDAITKPSDFGHMSRDEMSAMFYFHLGQYIKSPDSKSRGIMKNAVHWANHADHELGLAFNDALQWAGIDLWADC